MALDMELDIFRTRLADCKDRSNNVQFGVTSKMLKYEEERQQAILHELRELENSFKFKSDKTSRTTAQYYEINNDIETNISSLRYLSGISNLEKIYSDLTGNISACVLHQSVMQNFPEDMLANKPLSGNINECWNYITKLANLSQVHLLNASHYHKFYHDINEVAALLKKRWKIISSQISSFEPKGTVKETDQLTNYLKDHQSYFLYLWNRTDNLQTESKKIIPIHLRQDPISQNSILGQSLYSYTSPEISFLDQEELVILNNTNPQLWKVQNSKGEVGEVPSVCIWIPGPDLVASDKANNLRAQLIKNWEQCLNRFTIILIDHYIHLFERLLSDHTIAVAKPDHFNNLIGDIQETLLANQNDSKSNELQKLLIEIRKKMIMRSSEDLRTNRFYKESEIIKMHTPLLKFIDHIKNLRSLRDSIQFSQGVNRYREEVGRDNREKRFVDNVEILNKLHSENSNELNKLIKRMETMPHEIYKTRQSNNIGYNSRNFEHSNADYHQHSSSVSDLRHTHNLHLNSQHFHSHTDLLNEQNSRIKGISSSSASLSNAELRMNNPHSFSESQFIENYHSSLSGIDDQRETFYEYQNNTKSNYSLAAGLTNTEVQFTKPRAHRGGKKKIWKIDSQTQLTVNVRDSKIQCTPMVFDESTYIEDDIFSTTNSSLLSNKKRQTSSSRGTYYLDAQTQIGVLFRDSSSQSEIYTESSSSRSQKKRNPKKVFIDSITQIGRFTESVGIQTHLEKTVILQNSSALPKHQMDTMTQISVLLNDRIVQTTSSKSKRMKRDCQTQIGTLQNEIMTQTNVHHKSKSIQKSCMQLDAITQMSIVSRSNDTQTENIEDSLQSFESVKIGEVKKVIYIKDNFTDMAIYNKKSIPLQTGKPALFPDAQNSSQTDYINIDQTVQVTKEIYANLGLSEAITWEYEILDSRDMVDAEVQSELFNVKYKGKKLQHGYSKILEYNDSTCQISTILKEMDSQTEFGEYENIDHVREAKSLNNFQNESVQWENDEVKGKNKKLQIGNSRLESDFEVSCQTGCLVRDSKSQTDTSFILDNKIEINQTESLYNEYYNSQAQAEIYEDEVDKAQITTKGKIIQTRTSRLLPDFEVSCQTGHIVIEAQSQTEFDYVDNINSFTYISLHKEVEFSESLKSDNKKRGKKIQVGYPQLNMKFDVACQSFCVLSSVDSQTDLSEIISSSLVQSRRNMDIDLIEEKIQWDGLQSSISNINERKTKKLQIGTTRLDIDYEVSCQTGYIMNESESQTENYYNVEVIKQIKQENEHAEKEVQCEYLIESIRKEKLKGKKIQVGYPQLNEHLSSAFQHGHIIQDVGNETDMIKTKVNMIEESIQYNDNTITVTYSENEFKSKIIQKGTPKLGLEFEVSCQTGRIVINGESQTEHDYEDNVIIKADFMGKEELSFDKSSQGREYCEKEMQSDYIVDEDGLTIKTFKSKKIQHGYPKLNNCLEVECQTGCIVDDVEQQTEVKEFIIMESREIETISMFRNEKMIEECIQYDVLMDNIAFQLKESKGKKLQVGKARLDYDKEVCCQTGHLIIESESQTELDYEDKIIIKKDFMEKEELSFGKSSPRREYCEKEMQSDYIVDEDGLTIKTFKSKKIQHGYPKLNKCLEVECQTGCIVDDVEQQTEVKEFIIMESREIETISMFRNEKMIEECIQYDVLMDNIAFQLKESKGKKLQVGNARLDYDKEVCCQTGHLIIESESQTELDYEDKIIIKRDFMEKEELSFGKSSPRREYCEKEMQSDYIVDEDGLIIKTFKSKKIQYGYPKLNNCLEVECQTGFVVDDVEQQTEVDEFMIMESRENEALAMFHNEKLIEEIVQYDVMKDETIAQFKETKGKKLQVGRPRLDYDYEVCCQTGHMIRESESQTVLDYEDNVIITADLMRREELSYSSSSSRKEYSEKEMQSDYIVDEDGITVKTCKSKKIQYGYPRLNKCLEVECQTGCIVDDVEQQTEVSEFVISESREQEAIAMLNTEKMIEEEVQYDVLKDNIILETKDTKGKKLQVGKARLDYDYEVCCQTGHLIIESESQTELDYEDNVIITADLMKKEQLSYSSSSSRKEYSEKEMQSDYIVDEDGMTVKTSKSKKIQYGYPRLNKCLEVECQTGCVVDDVEQQTEVDEFMIMESRDNEAIALIKAEKMIEEIIQYDVLQENFNCDRNETKGKKLQVGNARLDYDYEVCCQTGHLIIESESQTEFDYEDNVIIKTDLMKKEQLSYSSSSLRKEYSEKEMQSDYIVDEDGLTIKTCKSKKIQYGYPRLNKCLEVECQTGCVVDDVEQQTEVDEFMIMESRENEAIALFHNEKLIDETVQYDIMKDEKIAQFKETKGKKLQVGRPRLDYDYEVCCQTGHMIRESESQTVLDYEDNVIITADLMRREELSYSSSSSRKEYSEKEMQSDYIVDEDGITLKTCKSKKIQYGYPRLNIYLEVECQTGCIVDDVEQQTEVSEFVISESREQEAIAMLKPEKMIEEIVQYDVLQENFNYDTKETKAKKLQVGNARLDYDYEVCCQTGHLIIESESQTEFDYEDNVIIKTDLMKKEQLSYSSSSSRKEYSEKEMQSDYIVDEDGMTVKTSKSKKIQYGYPRLNKCLEVECQTGCVVDDVEQQTEVDEFMIMESRDNEAIAMLQNEKMIEESIQYDLLTNIFNSEMKETKGKKLQVGKPRLDYDYEVCCQTGHLIMESESQTELDYEDNVIIKTDLMKKEQLSYNSSSSRKEYSEKEMQSDYIVDEDGITVKTCKSKKIQYGYPRLNKCLEVECQTGCVVDDVEQQTEVDEFMIMESRENEAIAMFQNEKMIEEFIQYDLLTNIFNSEMKETKGKKLQVGNARLDYDYEVCCQTGHLIMESESQTEFDYEDNVIITADLMKKEELSYSSSSSRKEYSEKELQSDYIVDEDGITVKTCKSKKIQYGYPRLNIYLEVECQTGCVVDDVEQQTEVSEFVIMEKREKEAIAMLKAEKMIEEEIQYDGLKDNIMLDTKETKGKKLQVGNARLDYDYEVCCQTGHLIMESESQTEFDYEDNVIIKTDLVEKEQLSYSSNSLRKEYSEKEMQSDYIVDEDGMTVKTSKSKKIQYGYPRLNKCLEVECQTGCVVDDVEQQTEVDEFMIMESRDNEALAMLQNEKMIEESIQYDLLTNIFNSEMKETKGKKLQVGKPRLDYDYEVCCQTGHLIMESESQTELDYEDNVIITADLMKREELSYSSSSSRKEYSEKEMQSDYIVDEDGMNVKTCKSKKIQYGYPKLNKCLEVECQTGCLVDDVEQQTEVDEFMIMESRENEAIAMFQNEKMIEEFIQYDLLTNIFNSEMKETKGKKLQVGNARLDYDYEVCCQTGHLIMESESQTELDYEDNVVITKDLMKREERSYSSNSSRREYSEKEMQSDDVDDDTIIRTKTCKSKKIQYGFPRLNKCLEVECQTGCVVDDVEQQTEVDEFMIMESRENEALSMFKNEMMIEEFIQYDLLTNIFNSEMKETKGKKLQVGNARLDYDYEVYCQTGHLIMESESQTELDYEDNVIITADLMRMEEISYSSSSSRKEYSEKEMQSDYIADEYGITVKTCKSKKIQFGYPRMNKCLEVECQTGCVMDDVEQQTEINDFMIMESSKKRAIGMLNAENLIEEIVQYDLMKDKRKSEIRDTKGKKLQVGNARLDFDHEVCCQTGHLIMDAESQTQEGILNNRMEGFLIKSKETDMYSYHTEYVDSEAQEGSKLQKSKKIQTGHTRCFESFDVQCQNVPQLNDFTQQLGLDDLFQITETDSKKYYKDQRFIFTDLIDEEIQFNKIESLSMQKAGKGKKLQVGVPKLNFSYDACCQAGHLIKDSENQSYDSSEINLIKSTIVGQEQSFKNKFPALKDFNDKEIQYYNWLNNGIMESKSVQVGYSKLINSFDNSSQCDNFISNISQQTDFDDYLIVELRSRKENSEMIIEDLVDEEIQYNTNEDSVIKSTKISKGKKLQVGTPNLGIDHEVSCQTEHMIIESKSRTPEDHIDNMIIIPNVVEKEKQPLTIKSIRKTYSDTELQSDNIVDEDLPMYRTLKRKKVQVGYPRLNEAFDIECQTDSLMDDNETKVKESFIIEMKDDIVKAAFSLEEMIDESIQYYITKNMFLESERNLKGKKLQVGTPHLDDDVEACCQTGHLIIESEAQTYDDYINNVTEIQNIFKKEQSFPTQSIKKEYFNTEIQSDYVVDEDLQIIQMQKKKLQVGFPRLNDSYDIECQSGCIMYDNEQQTEVNEYFIMEKKDNNVRAMFNFEDMIDESIQYNLNRDILLEPNRNLKRKKTQVGTPHLENDYEVCFQTGHLITESESQTYEDYIEMAKVVKREKLSDTMQSKKKEYSDSEMQSDYAFDEDLQLIQMLKSKKIQVGHPRLINSLDVECQTGHIIDVVEQQTDDGEYLVYTKKEYNVEKMFNFNDMIDESIQYDLRDSVINVSEKDYKGKKLQVGTSHLDYDTEASCQTGHLIIDKGNQTYEDYKDSIEVAKVVKREKLSDTMQSKKKEYSDSEMQSDYAFDEDLQLIQMLKSKKIQVGHPRLINSLDVECQTGHIIDVVEQQTDDGEYLVYTKKEYVEKMFNFNDMIDESIQYDLRDFVINVSEKDYKGKKLQVGTSHLDYDTEASCQTGHLIIEKGNQTYEDYKDSIEVAKVVKREKLSDTMQSKKKEYSDSEMQSDYAFDEDLQLIQMLKSKKIQVGHPRLINDFDAECQSGYVKNDIGQQTEDDEYFVYTEKEYNVEKMFNFNDMIDESIQYDLRDSVINVSEKDYKGKKLQVGTSHLDYDTEASCQTGHLIIDKGNQTYEDYKDSIEVAKVVKREKLSDTMQSKKKEYSDSEMQSDYAFDQDLQLIQMLKSKKIQVGHPRLINDFDAGCQSGYVKNDIGQQTEDDEYFVYTKKEYNVEKMFNFNDMIEESIQYELSSHNINVSGKDYKYKKSQLGTSRLDYDTEVSCQTEYLLTKSEDKTYEDYITIEIPQQATKEKQSRTLESRKKEYSDKEMQADYVTDDLLKINKINLIKNQILTQKQKHTECQTDFVIKNIEQKAESVEYLVIKEKECNLNTSDFHYLTDEAIQYNVSELLIEKSTPVIKEKKDYSVNSSKIVNFSKESESQTDLDLHANKIVIPDFSENSLKLPKYTFCDVEIQSDFKLNVDDLPVSKQNSEKCQVGYRRINNFNDVASQVDSSMNDIEQQAVFKESDLLKMKEEKVYQDMDKMVSEGIQFNNDQPETVKKMKNMNLQIGILSSAIICDISCQTGHLIRNSGSQTPQDSIENNLLYSKNVNRSYKVIHKGYSEKEIQSGLLNDFVQKTKIVQVGNSRLGNCIDVECQFESKNNEVFMQTNLKKSTENFERRNEDLKWNSLSLHNEVLQYSTPQLFIDSHLKETKGKKLQVGYPKLFDDRINSCQTELSVIEAENQIVSSDVVKESKMDVLNDDNSDVLYNLHEELTDKEIEPELSSEEIAASSILQKSKKIQAGNSRLQSNVDKEFQSETLMNDILKSTEEEIINDKLELQESRTLFLDQMLEEELQYGSRQRQIELLNKQMKGKKVQVGVSRLGYELESSCQTEIGLMDSFNQSLTDHIVTSVNRKKLLNKSDNRMPLDSSDHHNIYFQAPKDKMVQVGNEKLDSGLNTELQGEHKNPQEMNIAKIFKYSDTNKPIHKKCLVDREIQYKGSNNSILESKIGHRGDNILFGSATWDYDTPTYNLLTFDVKIENNLRPTDTNEQSDFILNSNEMIQPTDFVSGEEGALMEPLYCSDMASQTLDYVASHSVSLQISPKIKKFDNEAQLILNYFNKQIDIKQDKHEYPEENLIFSVQKDSNKTLLNRGVGFSKSLVRHNNHLSDINFPDAVNNFNEHTVNTFPQPVSNVIDKFKKGNDMVNIPYSNTKDYINLFESIAVQVNEKDDIETVQDRGKISDKDLKKYIEVSIEHDYLQGDVIEASKKSTFENAFSDGMEISLAPKFMDLKAKKMAKNILTEAKFEEIERKNIVQKELGKASDSIYSRDEKNKFTTKKYTIPEQVEIRLLSKLNDDRTNTSIAKDKKDLSKLKDEERMFEYSPSNMEASIFDDFSRRSNSGNFISLEHLRSELVEISLAPKLIKIKPERTGTGFPYSVQCDSKMTSTPKVIEKSNVGTQIYMKPLYDGQTQTSITSHNYGIQVADHKSQYLSSLISPISFYSVEKDLNNSVISSSIKRAKYNNACLDTYFEDDYIVECIKSRSIVTTKQEVLPKLSHDFADNREEPATWIVTDKDKRKSKLCNTKCQSWNENSFREMTTQTLLELTFTDKEIFKVYNRLISSRKLKEVAVQESNDDNLFEVLIKNKGLKYIMNKYRKSVVLCEESNQTSESINFTAIRNSETIQSDRIFQQNAKSEYLSNLEGDYSTSIINSSRPSHKNKRIQRGCGYFKMKDVQTNTVESYGDHIEVTYTETILEESIITKRPLSKIDDHLDLSKSSSLTKRSASSTSVYVSNQHNKYSQSTIYKSDIFIQEENCDQFLVIIKSFHVTAVYDHYSKKYLSLKDGIRNGNLNLEENKYFMSKKSSMTIEQSINDGYLIISHDRNYNQL